MRVLDFSDGFGSESEPSLGSIIANSLFRFPSDAAFVEYKGEPAVGSDVYFNTTLNHVRWFDGTIWVSGLFQDASGNVVIAGDLTILGTTTTINTENLVVTDKNITVNKNGTDLTAQGAGLTVEREGTHGSFVYDSATTSKWKAGALGSEKEVATVSDVQTLTNKTLSSPHITTPTGITKSDVGLGNVNNTADADKPISTAAQTAIDDLQDQLDSFEALPIGGAIGQALTKKTATDFDVEWTTIQSGVNVSATQTLSNAGVVAIGDYRIQRVKIQGDAANVVVTLPNGNQDGDLLYIKGVSDSVPPSIVDSSNCNINGSIMFTAGKVAGLLWDLGTSKWDLIQGV